MILRFISRNIWVIIRFTLVLKREKKKTVQELCLRNKAILGSVGIPGLTTPGHEVKLSTHLFTSLEKAEGECLNTNMHSGYKESVPGQAETSDLLKSSVNLKALTKTNSVLPNIFWHNSKTRTCWNLHHSEIYQLMICNSHDWHSDVTNLFLNITCQCTFYASLPYLTRLWA